MVLRKHRIAWECSAVIAAALVLVFAGCGLFSSRDGALVFNHRVHSEKGMTCDSCHEAYEEELSAGMPAYEICLTCHGPKADRAATPYELEIQKHAPEEAFRSREKYYDLKFSHAAHHAKDVACSACHGEVGTSEEVSRDHSPSAETCLACHREKGVGTDCSVCHQNLRKNTPPRTHQGDVWKRTHGKSSADGWGDKGHNANCQLCHAQSACDQCHRVEKPQDHTEFFRQRGHGAFVSNDRDRCMACHQESFCVRCHNETAPRNHFNAAWGGTQSNHCLHCHADFSESNCSVCHKSAPSHSQATRIPGPPHPSPTANCYTCHLKPPHADGGVPCTVCHKR